MCMSYQRHEAAAEVGYETNWKAAIGAAQLFSPSRGQAVKSIERAGSKAAALIQGDTSWHHHAYDTCQYGIRIVLSHLSGRKQVTFAALLYRWSSFMLAKLILWHIVRDAGGFSLHHQLATALQLCSLKLYHQRKLSQDSGESCYTKHQLSELLHQTSDNNKYHLSVGDEKHTLLRCYSSLTFKTGQLNSFLKVLIIFCGLYRQGNSDGWWWVSWPHELHGVRLLQLHVTVSLSLSSQKAHVHAHTDTHTLYTWAAGQVSTDWHTQHSHQHRQALSCFPPAGQDAGALAGN